MKTDKLNELQFIVMEISTHTIGYKQGVIELTQWIEYNYKDLEPPKEEEEQHGAHNNI